MKTFASCFRQRTLLSLVPTFQATNSRSTNRVSPALNYAPSRGFFSSPALAAKDSGRVTIRASESVDVIERDVASLLQTELKTLYEDVEDAGKTIEDHQQEFISNGFTVEAADQEVKITKESQGRTVSVVWNPSYNPPQQEEDEIPQDDEEEDAEPEYEYEDDGRIPVDITVTKGNSETLHLECGVKNSALNVYKIGCDSESYVAVSDLSEDLQDRIYDYLTELGVGDETATLIQDYNRIKETSNYLNSVKQVNKFFSSKK